MAILIDRDMDETVLATLTIFGLSELSKDAIEYVKERCADMEDVDAEYIAELTEEYLCERDWDELFASE